MTTPEEIKAEYTSSLADLTFNSKPLINVLTMLAEENLPNARIIVEAIEEHLAKVAVDVKLPILYLVDCIVKNVGQTYTALFSQNIVSTFCNVFKVVDEKTRSEMFKLRQTWNDVFPQMKLYAIDVQIHQIDPAWPVTAQPTNSIHFNPRFLINSTSTKQANNNQKTETSPATTSAVTPKVTPAADIETLLMQEQLIQKQKELLELQKKTLELEVLQTQVKLQEQIKAGRNPPISTNILLKPEVAKQLVPEGSNRTKSETLAGPAQSTNRLKINPVNATLASARPIRDPRLMRLQPKVVLPTAVNTATTQKTPVESNKRVQNKQSVRENPKDPRLAGKKPKILQKMRTDSPSKFNSGSSSSLSGPDSPSKGKQQRTIGAKHKKRDKGTDAKRPHQDYEPPKQDVNSESGKDFKSNSAKNRGRDYVKREDTNTQGEDYRPVPKTDKVIPDVPQPVAPEPSVSSSKPMDVDLRQLNPAPLKKRASSETSDQPSKKSRSFDVLFGSEDTDLRPLIPLQSEVEPVVDRPPTPPPPIISAEKRPVSPKRNDLDAIRAKLANATNRDKALSKSFHKNKLQQDQDLRAKAPAKLTISPEEEKVIQSGHMTPEQGKQILTKYLSRFEKDKLREAKKKDHENTLGDVSLQTISDDDDFGSDVEIVSIESNNAKPTTIPFNDKDERLNMHHPEDNGNYHTQQFYGRRASFRPARDGWRGGRGRNAPPPGPQSRQQVRPWMHQQQPRWRGQYRPDFPSNEDDASRSPGQDHNSQELTVLNEVNKTLPIDGINRDIRIYGDTAIIFMNYDDPREISFQNGARRAVFNNKESYLLTFGSGYTECPVNGVPFRVKLGAPTREIVIDDVGFECYFGGPPIHITVGGIKLTVALEGPPPQVNISDEKRTDLVAGKINMIVNATLMVPVFLDAKVQKFVLDGEVCTLKFTDSLKKVVINDEPFKVEFGGLPKPFMINGKKNFIRFSVLPKGVTPGFVKIKDMEGESGVSPVREEQSEFSGPLVAEPLRPEVVKIGPTSPDNGSNSPTQTGLTNFDVLSNVLSQSFAAPATGGYQVQIPGLAPPQEAPKPALNINELFQKLVASGFVKTQEKPSEPAAPTVSSNANPPVPVPENNLQKSQKRNLSVALKPVTFTRPETLKIRQGALYSILYTGMQCSSCGMRFPPEASMWYSQHLDWHFRQNRRGKKNARVANSRKWYYSLSDWKNYEELEDLEEREKNYFDQQQQQQAEVAEEAEEETEIPTVPADPRTTDERCYVCRDTFEQFFNEDKEEWHLRNAIRVDENTYHPVCYEDHQKSILESSMDESKDQENDQNKVIPGFEIVLDDDEDNEEKESEEIVSLVDDDEEVKVPEDAPSPSKDEDVPIEDEGEDDDVILNEVAPIRIVVDDDDDEEPPFETDQPQESVIVKQEKKPIYDDGFIDVEEIVTLKDVGQVKIKSEPVDEDDMQRSFSETDPTNKEVEVEETRTTSHPQLITSMDGNVELSAPMVMVPTTISGGANRIKINISKPLPVITPKEVNSENSDSNAVIRPKELPPIEDLEPLSYKPALQNVPLKKLPPVKKGSELTGLCSIM